MEFWKLCAKVCDIAWWGLDYYMKGFWYRLIGFWKTDNILSISLDEHPTPYGCIQINIRPINRHILIICLFFYIQTGQLLHCVKIPPKAKTGGTWSYPTVKCRNTVKSSVLYPHPLRVYAPGYFTFSAVGTTIRIGLGVPLVCSFYFFAITQFETEFEKIPIYPTFWPYHTNQKSPLLTHFYPSNHPTLPQLSYIVSNSIQKYPFLI